MTLSKPSLSALLLTTIILMSSITVVFSIITGQVFREITNANQEDAIRDLAGHEIEGQFEQHESNVASLGQGIVKNNHFASALTSHNKKTLTNQLDSRFYQYYVTANIIDLKNYMSTTVTLSC